MAKDPSHDEALTAVASPRRARVAAITPITLPRERFHDEGLIARGGTSRVERIFDRTLLRYSAMKVLSEHLQPYPEQRERFIEEAQITLKTRQLPCSMMYEASAGSPSRITSSPLAKV